MDSHAVVSKFDVKPLQVKNSADRDRFMAQLAQTGWAPETDETLRCGRLQSASEAAESASNDDTWEMDAGASPGQPLWLPLAEKRGESCWQKLKDATFRDIAIGTDLSRRYTVIDYSFM